MRIESCLSDCLKVASTALVLALILFVFKICYVGQNIGLILSRLTYY